MIFFSLKCGVSIFLNTCYSGENITLRRQKSSSEKKSEESKI